MPSQPPRQPARAKRAPNTPTAPAPTPADAPTPTRLTMALAWVFVLGMLVLGIAAIFLVLRAL